MTRHLHAVPTPPLESEPEEELSVLVPRVIRLEADLAEVRQRIGEQRRRLADKRAVAFIREEHVRAEFGDA